MKLVEKEMNGHVPQSIGARTEANILMRVANHMITPQRNAPINSVIQDGLIGAYLVTHIFEDSTAEILVPVEMLTRCVMLAQISPEKYESFLERAKEWYPEYITKNARSGTHKLTKKSVPGKLFLSAVFPAGVTIRHRETGTDPRRPVVRIENGIITPSSGPMCPKIIGSKGGSVIQLLWKYFSPETAMEFTSNLQMFAYPWLTSYGYTIAIDDCLVKSDNKKNVDKLLSDLFLKDKAIRMSSPVDLASGPRDPKGPVTPLEAELSNVFNTAINVGLKNVVSGMNNGERNGVTIARNSGAKGSPVNLIQMSSFVGQQNIGGKRIPTMLSGNTRTHPSFFPGDNSPLARGFVSNGFLQGLRPQEAFFHAMSGRQGIISTSLRTASSGYKQKNIARKMEEYRVIIDGSVRNSAGCILQFLYGDDGMDAKKLVNVPGLEYPFFVDPEVVANMVNCTFDKTTGDSGNRVKISNKRLTEFVDDLLPNDDNKVKNHWKQHTKKTLLTLLKKVKIHPDALERFLMDIRDTYHLSLSPYGEMVGLIAALSISEPTTQLVLNTFHSAGVKSKDVSLGLPRMEEILNATKSNKQKKGSCVIFFEDLPVSRELCVARLKDQQSSLEESNLSKFIDSPKDSGTNSGTELQYCKTKTPLTKRVSPVMFDTVTEFTEPEWLKVYGDLHPDDDINIESWVIRIKLSLKALYTSRITVTRISDVINSVCGDTLKAVGSPVSHSELLIFPNFEILRDYTYTKKLEKEPKNLPKGRSPFSIITKDNVDYFLCRDILLPKLKNVLVSGIPGIEETFVRESIEDKTWVLDVSLKKVTQIRAKERFLKIMSLSGIDTTRTSTDDVHIIYETLGIEAARQFLLEEFHRIISFDGTYINPRHIQLLVDSMTVTGVITAVRRDGISRDCGPIAKILFEQSVVNALEASAFTEIDTLKSLSSNVMFGTLGGAIGTAAVNVVTR